MTAVRDPRRTDFNFVTFGTDVVVVVIGIVVVVVVLVDVVVVVVGGATSPPRDTAPTVLGASLSPMLLVLPYPS